MCSPLALRNARHVIDLQTLWMVLWGILYHSSTTHLLSPSWFRHWSWRRCTHVTSSSNKCTIGSRNTTGKLRTLMPFFFFRKFCVIYPTVVTATTVRQREMFSQMTLAYVRFVTWHWHIRLIMFWKINCWFCRIKTRAITGLLWRRTLKRLATYYWLTPTCSIPIAFCLNAVQCFSGIFCFC